MYEIPKKLVELSIKLGVKLNLNAKVNGIETEGNKITGITTDEKFVPYDTVISNADVNYTYKKLLKDSESKLAKRYAKLEKSSSAIVFYWGVKGIHKDLEIHNILFSNDYEKEFDQIFSKGTIPEDPTVYVYISSKFNNGDVPEGCENWFVMINAPYDKNHDWDELVKISKERILNKIFKYLKIDLSQKIIFEKILHPRKIEMNTNSISGSIYGISSNNKMAAFLRQQNKSKHYKGLYFCGGSAHPGGGVPLVILSGKITAELVNKYEIK
jgi:phytoene desaturase